MAQFTYNARSRTGERSQGTLEAPDRRAAVDQLERMGFTPISVKEGPGAPAKKGSGKKKPAAAAKEAKGSAKKKKPTELVTPRRGRSKMKMREVVLFTRELSDLLSSGMTLGNALHTLARRDMAPAQKTIITELRDRIVQGASLSEALEGFPETFPPLFVNLVRAGEASGQLSEVLIRLCDYNEMVQESREKVISALIYPIIVLTMGLGTMVFTMVFVVPRFSAIFEELGSTLPLPTRILVGMSSGLMYYGWAIAAAIVAFVVLFRRFIKTPSGRRMWDGFKLRMPVFRDIIKANAFAQFARTLESLLSNGVPVLQALSIVENTVGNVVIAEEIQEARERVTDGATISGPLSQGQVFPSLLTDMLAVGEESGDVAAALGHIGKRYETELDRTVKVLTTVLEPVLILLMAVLVGFVAISMLLAVFDLTSGLNV